MKLTEFFASELDREVERSRRTLAEVPDGKYDWMGAKVPSLYGPSADDNPWK